MSINKIIVGVAVIVVAGFGFLYLRPVETNLQEPIKIGVIGPFTVKVVNIGEDMLNAVNLAVEEENKNREIFQVLYEDDKCDAKEAVSTYHLLKQNGVKIIVGAICSSGTLAIAPLAEQDKIVLITPASAAEEITQAGDYIFRNHVTIRQKTGKLAELMSDKFQKVATIYDQGNGAYVLGEKIVAEKFQQNGKQVVSREGFQKGVTDFRTSLTKIKNDNPDVVYIGALMPEAALIVKQMRDLKISAQIICDDGFIVDSKFADMGIGKTEGIIFATTDFGRENNSQFWDTYSEKFGRSPTVFAAQSYDSLKILAKVINENCQEGNTTCVKSELYNIKDYLGVGGLISFDQNGDVVKSVILKTIKDGEFVKYEE